MLTPKWQWGPLVFQGCTRWLLPKIASNKFVELSPIQREENSEGSEDADAWSMLSRLLILGRWKINGWEIMVLAIGSEHLCDSISFFFLFFFECSDVSVWRISSSLDIKHSNACLLYVGLFGVLAPFILTGATKYSLVSLYIYIYREREREPMLTCWLVLVPYYSRILFWEGRIVQGI